MTEEQVEKIGGVAKTIFFDYLELATQLRDTAYYFDDLSKKEIEVVRELLQEAIKHVRDNS